MSDVLLDEQNLYDIADAIREKLSTQTTITLDVNVTVSGGYNGGAVISIKFNDSEVFSATGDSPYNLSYNNTSATISTDLGNADILVIPPSSSTGKLNISININNGEFEYTSGDISPEGANTSYGYNFVGTEQFIKQVQPITTQYLPSEMAEAILSIPTSSGDITLMSRAQWDALTTEQKQSYGLVAIRDTETGFMQGVLVNGAEYEEIGKYIPNSDSSKIICEAYIDNFNSAESTWGIGDNPVIFTGNNHELDTTENAISILTQSQGDIGYIDLETANTVFTAYVVMKLVNPSTYSQIISAMNERSTSAGIILYGSTINVSSWGSDTLIGISSTDYFVAAMQFGGSGTAGGIVRGSSYVSKSPSTAGRYVTIGRTDIDASTTNAEPCDLMIKYIAVVKEYETQSVIEDNLEALYNSFLAE